ncbi:MAG: hypothetical protein LBF97_00480 [Elusimicrobiota bacterium]|jgi:hypothetical protein|nr:hypothetical protein [Elusimicrobiota bacterium]
MNNKELQFKQRYENIIKKYDIKTTFQELLKYAENKFLEQANNKKTISLVDIGMEKELCKISPLFFISEYCYIELKGKPLIPAGDTLYYFQKEIIKQSMNYKKVVFTKTRQAGLSTLNALLMFWKALLFPSQWIVIISKDAQSSHDFLDKIKINLEHIPQFLNIKNTINNVQSLKFSNKSLIQAFARSKTSGRGTSPTEVVLDELAFYQTNTIVQGIIASINAAISRTGGRITMISTPNGNIEGSEGYYYWTQVNQLEQEGGENKKDSSKLYYIDWWMCPDLNGILPYKGYNKELKEFENKDYFNNKNVYFEARKFFDPIAKNWKNNDWLRNQHKTSGEILFRQEILRDFVVMQSTVFTNDIFEKIQKQLKDPILKDILNDKPTKNLYIWKQPEPGQKFVIGIDVATGTSLDSSCIEVIDANTYEQVAEYIGKCTTYDLAFLAERTGYYYNTAMIFLESNSIGESSFTILDKDLNYPNLYKQKKSSSGVIRFTGWYTSTKSRQIIINKFIETLYDDEEEVKIYSERLLGQIKTLVFGEGGKVEAVGSAHDDAIMAYAIALFNAPAASRELLSFFIDEDGNKVSHHTDNTKIDTITSLDSQIYEEAREKFLRESNIQSMEDIKWILG